MYTYPQRMQCYGCNLGGWGNPVLLAKLFDLNNDLNQGQKINDFFQYFFKRMRKFLIGLAIVLKL